MEEQRNRNPSHGASQQERAPAQPVRSRWTPKPEQILILESIFNSGMVNPPKDETVRIRKFLEKFGAVGDANVFYWFQNRRSRSRRRQRQIQASLAAAAAAGGGETGGGAVVCEPASSGTPSTSSSSSSGGAFLPYASLNATASSASASPGLMGDGSADDLFSISRQMVFIERGRNPMFQSSEPLPQLPYQPGLITVFINGISTEIPRGPIDMRVMFGANAILIHSSGELVPINEHGVLFQGLQVGESYFLVWRSI